LAYSFMQGSYIRIVLALLVFTIGFTFSVVGAFLLRLDFSISQLESYPVFSVLFSAIPIKLVVFWRMGLNRGWWRYASLSDAIEILQATLLSTLILTIFLVLTFRLEGVPRSVLMLDAGLTFLFFSGLRFSDRVVREIFMPGLLRNSSSNASNTLVIGAGDSGQAIVREIRKNSTLQYNIVGFVDDDPLKKNERFQGTKVLGTIDDLVELCEAREISEIIVAMPKATARQMRRAVDLCAKTVATVKTLPAMADLINGRVSIQQVRDVDVKDLLGRRIISLDLEKLRGYLTGKRILVTGAAGSIGSEICRQVARFDPEAIAIFDMAESPLFFVERELLEIKRGYRVIPVICDIRNGEHLRAMVDKIQPHVIFHAAAYKHVPLMERNPVEAISTNVMGSRLVADCADKFGVENFVMISTDKAVNPTSIMGATKRCAEIYVQNLARNSETHFVTVRFGNVLDSAGSVIPIFREQIKNGGPVTVTHPEVTRFFMTISEATQLVLQAGGMGKGGEIFLLDMGEPVKIVKLAEELIRLSGFEPYEGVDIEFCGLRPGEKLYEELLLSGEGVKPTEHEAISVALAVDFDSEQVASKLDELIALGPGDSHEMFVKKIQELVVEYEPQSNEDLDITNEISVSIPH